MDDHVRRSRVRDRRQFVIGLLPVRTALPRHGARDVAVFFGFRHVALASGHRHRRSRSAVARHQPVVVHREPDGRGVPVPRLIRRLVPLDPGGGTRAPDHHVGRRFRFRVIREFPDVAMSERPGPRARIVPGTPRAVVPVPVVVPVRLQTLRPVPTAIFHVGARIIGHVVVAHFVESQRPVVDRDRQVPHVREFRKI